MSEMYECPDCGWYGDESGVELVQEAGDNIFDGEFAICNNCGSKDCSEIPEDEQEAWLDKRREQMDRKKNHEQATTQRKGEYMTVKEIVSDWLKAHGYTGLAGYECGCTLDDLMPCGDGFDIGECEAGYDHEECKKVWKEWGSGKSVCVVKDCKDCKYEV